ncbi:hypothetical protein ABZP36_025394 [Zizania latifolia]
MPPPPPSPCLSQPHHPLPSSKRNMANRCASLDATWACLPGPAPSPWAAHPSWLSPVGASFEDDALTAALWASMSPPVGAAAASSSSNSYCSASPTPSSSTTTTTSSAEILAATSARPGNGGPARAAASPPPPQPKYNPTVVSPTMATFPVAAAAGDEASSLLQELEAMVSAPPAVAPAFPTLESWGMI